jgi:phosphate-selective porin OprO/OprP
MSFLFDTKNILSHFLTKLLKVSMFISASFSYAVEIDLSTPKPVSSSLKAGGLLQLDLARYDEAWGDSGTKGSDLTLRRMRFYVQYNVHDDYRIRLQARLYDNGDAKIEDAYLQYSMPWLELYHGKMLEPIGLENLTSPKWMVANELSLISDIISPGRNVGVQGRTNFGPVHMQSGIFRNGRERVFGDNASSRETTGAKGDFNLAYVLRLFIPYKFYEGGLLHLGLDAMQREVGGEEVLLRTSANVVADSYFFAKTVGGVDASSTLGAEVSVLWNSLSLQGEAYSVRFEGSQTADETWVDGAYILATWNFSSHRNYLRNEGAFGQTVAESTAIPVELFGRWSGAGIKSAINTDIEEWTAGATAYFKKHVKVSLNFTRAERRTAGDHSENYALVIRTQSTF